MIYRDYAATVATEENFSLGKEQINAKLGAWLGNYIPRIPEDQVCCSKWNKKAHGKTCAFLFVIR